MDDEGAYELANPRAGALIDSFRGLGYSLGAAIADLIDNSISAGASEIDLRFSFNGANSFLAISDDGDGMCEPVLSNAMILGSQSPSEVRVKGDLGRFGLGLKTASFSQAQELTVMSRTAGEAGTNIRRWDLDTVRNSSEWRLLMSPSGTAAEILNDWDAENGTIVVWTKCDRLVAEDQDAESHFYAAATAAAQHVGMVFHRFLETKRVSITWNGNKIQGWDPYFINPKHAFTQDKGIEEHTFRGKTKIRAHTYLLPHRNELSEDERRRGAGLRGWNDQQGFYVYRDDRIIIDGGWLGLLANDEHTKLARIALDISSTLDHDWQVDVTKNSLQLPAEMRAWLLPIAEASRREAQLVYRRRGAPRVSRRDQAKVVPIWLDSSSATSIKFKVNSAHPAIRQITEQSEDPVFAKQVLRIVGESLPVNIIATRISAGTEQTPEQLGGDLNELRALLRRMIEITSPQGPDELEILLGHLRFAEPFVHYPEVIQLFREESK